MYYVSSILHFFHVYIDNKYPKQKPQKSNETRMSSNVINKEIYEKNQQMYRRSFAYVRVFIKESTTTTKKAKIHPRSFVLNLHSRTLDKS